MLNTNSSQAPSIAQQLQGMSHHDIAAMIAKMHIPEHLDSQSRDTRTLKRQHLDISPAHLNS